MLLPQDRMMNSMHARRNEHKPNVAFDPFGCLAVGMSDQSRHGCENIGQNNSDRRRSDKSDHEKDKKSREQRFDRMKPEPDREIVIVIGMVDSMKPPKKRDMVQEVMMAPPPKIDCQDAKRHGEPRRNIERRDQPHPAFDDDNRESQSGNWKDQENGHCAEDAQTEISTPPDA